MREVMYINLDNVIAVERMPVRAAESNRYIFKTGGDHKFLWWKWTVKSQWEEHVGAGAMIPLDLEKHGMIEAGGELFHKARVRFQCRDQRTATLYFDTTRDADVFLNFHKTALKEFVKFDQ